MQQKKIYCETFMLGPLKINLGLKMREGSLSDRGYDCNIHSSLLTCYQNDGRSWGFTQGGNCFIG